MANYGPAGEESLWILRKPPLQLEIQTAQFPNPWDIGGSKPSAEPKFLGGITDDGVGCCDLLGRLCFTAFETRSRSSISIDTKSKEVRSE